MVQVTKHRHLDDKDGKFKLDINLEEFTKSIPSDIKELRRNDSRRGKSNM